MNSRRIKTHIPHSIHHGTARLFKAGLADPRDGIDRQIEIKTQDDKTRSSTHGWVFSSHYAVCWNGLVYRALSVGPGADLETDIQAFGWSIGMPDDFCPANRPRTPPGSGSTCSTINLSL